MVKVAAVTLALVLVVACDDPKSAKVDLARHTVKKLAYEGYGMWSLRPSNTGKCPDVAMLSVVAEIDATRDPWGAEYRIRCDHPPSGLPRVEVYSLGPDGKESTADDIRAGG